MAKSVLKYGLLALVISIAPMLLATKAANAISLPRTMPNGKVCRNLLGHAHGHSGKSKVMARKVDARAAAIRRWSRFTAWEYGPEWGDYGYAEGRSMTCWVPRRGGWKCKAKGQPCRH